MGEIQAIPLCYRCAIGGQVVIAAYICVSYWTDEQRWLQRFFCTQHSPLTEAQDHPPS